MKKFCSAIIIIAALFAAIDAFAINHVSRPITLYFSIANQTWASVGSAAPNQTTSNYIQMPTGITYTCTVANVGCTYELVHV